MSLALHYGMRDAHHCSGPPPHLRNDLYCVEWDVKHYYTILYHALQFSGSTVGSEAPMGRGVHSLKQIYTFVYPYVQVH